MSKEGLKRFYFLSTLELLMKKTCTMRNVKLAMYFIRKMNPDEFLEMDMGNLYNDYKNKLIVSNEFIKNLIDKKYSECLEELRKYEVI